MALHLLLVPPFVLPLVAGHQIISFALCVAVGGETPDY